MNHVHKLLVLTAALLPAWSHAGLVCTPVPAPLAGALGPIGLGVAGVAFVAYRVIKNRKK